MKKTIPFIAALSALACAAAVPRVTNVAMSQSQQTRDVFVTYTLSEAPAVVTVDFQTNVAGNVWASIGPQNFANADGDAFRRVSGTSGTIRWRAYRSQWVGNRITDGSIRAVVTAYAVDAPPDYMVVGLSGADKGKVRYYPSVEWLPGGLLENNDYRTSKIVMRRIPAKDVRWTMGNSTISVEPHTATLTNDYYLGVFELTQGQYKAAYGFYPHNNYYTSSDRDLYPCDALSFRRIRENRYNSTADFDPETDEGKKATDYFWPNPPYGWSLLGRLRAATDERVKFDLPTEAQWEFACKQGEYGNETWNNGLYWTAANMPGQSSDRAKDVTVAAGSFAPNALGLYDMHGNVSEFCLDWYAADISSLNGAINISAEDGTKQADGETDGATRVKRGSSCHYGFGSCRTAARSSESNNALWNNRLGLRVACPVEAVAD